MISEAEFREEALTFLEKNATPKVEEKTGWGEGSDDAAFSRSGFYLTPPGSL